VVDSLVVSGLPQSSQNAEEGEFSAAQLEQFLISALPQEAQNFRLVVLSFPHFVQRMSFLRQKEPEIRFYHPDWQGASTARRIGLT
jgi:hypothetical protein